jgi:hypothetical protein
LTLSLIAFIIALPIFLACEAVVLFSWARALRAYSVRRGGTTDLATIIASNMAPGEWLGFRALVQHQTDPELEVLRRRSF